MMNRRTFLQGIAAAAGALILPPTLEENAEAARRFWALDRTMVGKPLHWQTRVFYDGLDDSHVAVWAECLTNPGAPKHEQLWRSLTLRVDAAMHAPNVLELIRNDVQTLANQHWPNDRGRHEVDIMIPLTLSR